MNGGVCGRRAFYGRFILRAFGIPTTARPQKGHAALVHWTPDGWVACLGAGWGGGWTKGRYGEDLDFLATTQAREHMKQYMQVKRAQWIGDVMGEPRVFGFLAKGEPKLWYSVSLYNQRAINQENKAQTLAAVGESLAEASDSDKDKEEIQHVEITKEDRTISISPAGVITIPAAAASNPTKSTGKVIYMPSHQGGMQMHLSRGSANPVEYTFDAPAAGKYAFTARVATPSWKQSLTVTANDAEPATIDLPFTVGLWETTEPVEITLAKGNNVLRISRPQGMMGLTIKDMTLTPVK